ncbi:hypothetical protein ACOSQ4_006809 [Xanthoceras sorbifolium]
MERCGRNKYGERVTKRYNEYAGYVNKVNYGFNNHGGNPSHNGQVEKISSGFEYGKSSLVKDNSLNNRGVRGISGVNNQEGTSRGGSSRFEILEDVMEESEGGLPSVMRQFSSAWFAISIVGRLALHLF